MTPLMFRLFRIALVCAASALALSGCESLHPTADGPGNCMGPPGYCVPYFGS